MFCIILLFVLGISPVFAILISKSDYISFNKTVTNTINQKPNKENSLPAEYVINEAMTLADESFCEEGLKAALAIAENNLSYYIDNNIDTSTIAAENSDEFKKKLEKAYKKTNVTISHKDQCVYIPASSLSTGCTKTDEKFPYIKSVASPWDCQNVEFIYGKDYPPGISMKGINYLCEEGMNYKEALSWYLPNFDIK